VGIVGEQPVDAQGHQLLISEHVFSLYVTAGSRDCFATILMVAGIGVGTWFAGNQLCHCDQRECADLGRQSAH
jgi:hypothetical protein